MMINSVLFQVQEEEDRQLRRGGLHSTDGLAPRRGSLQGVAAQLAPPDRPQLDQRHLRRLRCQVSTRLGCDAHAAAEAWRAPLTPAGGLQTCPRALSAHGTGGTGAHRRRRALVSSRRRTGAKTSAHVSSPGTPDLHTRGERNTCVECVLVRATRRLVCVGVRWMESSLSHSLSLTLWTSGPCTATGTWDRPCPVSSELSSRGYKN